RNSAVPVGDVQRVLPPVGRIVEARPRDVRQEVHLRHARLRVHVGGGDRPPGAGDLRSASVRRKAGRARRRVHQLRQLRRLDAAPLLQAEDGGRRDRGGRRGGVLAGGKLGWKRLLLGRER